MLAAHPRGSYCINMPLRGGVVDRSEERDVIGRFNNQEVAAKIRWHPFFYFRFVLELHSTENL